MSLKPQWTKNITYLLHATTSQIGLNELLTSILVYIGFVETKACLQKTIVNYAHTLQKNDYDFMKIIKKHEN